MNNIENKKQKSPMFWLILIPAQIVMDIILFNVAMAIDSIIFVPQPNTLGHPVPAVTMFAVLILPVITIVVVVLSIILTIIANLKIQP